MGDYLFTSVVLAVGLLIHVSVLRRSEAENHRLLTVAFGGHAVSALVHVWLVLFYFPGGDMLGYYAEGVLGREALFSDFSRFAPEVWAAFVRNEYHLPFEYTGGGSTQSTSAVASLVLLVVGDSLYAGCMAVAIGAYLSQYSLYLALRDYFPAAQRQLVLAGTCLIPSGVFWSSALFKEGFIMTAVGPLVLALHWLATGRRRVLSLTMLLTASGVLALLKPYVLMALSIAAAIFYLRNRLRAASPELKPFALITSLLIGTMGFTIGSQFLGKSEAESSATVLANQRRGGYANEGGSDYYLDSPSGGDDAGGDDAASRTLAQELMLAPLALVTALFRPLIFEARNSVQLANSLEATFLLVLFVQILMRLGWAGLLRETMRSPVLAFCAVFALSLGLGTGLASSNLGTLSRYRAPMMPFFFTLLMVLRFGTKSRVEVEAARMRGAGAQSPWPPLPPTATAETPARGP